MRSVRALSLSKGKINTRVDLRIVIRSVRALSLSKGKINTHLTDALRQAQRTYPPTPLRNGQPFRALSLSKGKINMV